jgi:hypothetical protein
MGRGQMKLLAFSSWKCGCTILVKKAEEIPQRCPEHDISFTCPFSPIDWTDNPNRVPLGFEKNAGMAHERNAPNQSTR